jgi:hypothetical protein
MKRVISVVALGLLAACSGGDSSAGTTTSTTLLGGYGIGGGGGSSSDFGSSPSGSESDDGSLSGDATGGSASVEEGYCATGTYELDAVYLWAQISAVSPEGGEAEVVSGDVTLQLRDDLSAVLSMNDWTFRLYFPGQADTVLATQTGEMTGTWAVDEDGLHTISFDTDSITGTFVLETAQGSMPVPAGTETIVPPVGLELLAQCGVGEVVVPVQDQQLQTTIDWIFARV